MEPCLAQISPRHAHISRARSRSPSPCLASSSSCLHYVVIADGRLWAAGERAACPSVVSDHVPQRTPELAHRFISH